MKMFFGLFRFITAWWNTLYPRVCVICGEALVSGESFLCTRCLSKAPLNAGDEEEAGEELREDLGVEHVYWLFHYDRINVFHRWVYSLKYSRGKELGVWSGRMLGESMGKEHGIDRVVPVPLHPTREKERGFNQAFMIGTGIAAILKVEIETNLLTRVVNTRSQTGLSRDERENNVKKAFVLHDTGQLNGSHLLLVDDVITTGATIRACVRELEKIPGVRLSVASLGKAGKI